MARIRPALPLLRLFSLSALGLCGLGGCGLFNAADSAINNGVQGATATHLAVITVLQTPAVPGLDGGPAISAASVFFGNRPSETALEPVPVNGATVLLSDPMFTRMAPQVGDAGLYLASSATGPLPYDSNALYTFKLTDSAGAIYLAEGSAPPPCTA